MMRNQRMLISLTTLPLCILSQIVAAQTCNLDQLFPKQTVDVGVFPRDVMTADLNGDEIPDVISINQHSDDMTVMFGNGDGTFYFVREYALGDAPKFGETGDIDGDGDIDVVVANVLSDNVSVMLNQGGGIFEPGIIYATGDSPVSVSLIDLNHDHMCDMLIVNRNDDSARVMLGSGDGSFQFFNSFPTGNAPLFGSVGDIDNDGNLDLVTVNRLPSNIHVMLGNGNGSFNAPVIYDSPESEYLTLGDVDGDGDLDLVAANTITDSAGIHINLGDGTFDDFVEIPVGDRPESISLGDINNDSVLDMVVVSSISHDARTYLGDGDGGFEPETSYQAGSEPLDIELVDLNEDGNLDMMILDSGSNQVIFYLGHGDGTFVANSELEGAYNPELLSVTDLNNDGIADLSVNAANDATIFFYIGVGDGQFESAIEYEATGYLDFGLYHINDDSILDLVYTRNSPIDGIVVAFGNGVLSFDEETIYPTSEAPFSMRVADMDGDDDLDICVKNFSIQKNQLAITISKNNGDGTFEPPLLIEESIGAVNFTVADFTNDGLMDLMLSEPFSFQVNLLENIGGMQFIKSTVLEDDFNPGPILTRDINVDGFPDIVFYEYMLMYATVMLNQQDGSFAAPIRNDIDSYTDNARVIITDIDGDETPDLAITRSTTLRYLQGLGDGTFGEIQTIADDFELISGMSASDLDQDKDIDLLVGDRGRNHVRVMIASCRVASNCTADLTKDGVLNFFDVSAFVLAFQANDPIADLTNDGAFNFFDVSAFLSAFAQGCP